MSKRWMTLLASVAQGLLLGLAYSGAGLIFMSRLGSVHQGPSIALLLSVALFFPAVLVHELGHYAAARLAGMTVLQIHLFGVDFLARRRGWKIRWSGGKHRRYKAFVLAFPRVGHSMRPQMLSMIAGGPGANLSVAATLSAVYALVPGRLGDLLLAFALVNLGVGLANLVPSERVAGAASDGKKILAWLRKPDQNAAPFAYMRLISRMLSGQLAEEIPEDDLLALEQQAAPMPLVALVCRLKAHQTRGDWAQATAMIDSFERMRSALGDSMQIACAQLIAATRIELAFSNAMLTMSGDALTDPALPMKGLWSAPWLPSRTHALMAAFRGDSAECRRLLKVSKHLSDNSVDKSVQREEALMRERILRLNSVPAGRALSVD